MSRGLALHRPSRGSAHTLRGNPIRGSEAPAPLAMRARALVHRGRLDRELAEGVPPVATPALAIRARQLQSPRLRRGLARGLERSLTDAASPRSGRSAAPPVDRRQVSAAGPQLLELAARLREPGELGAQAVAMVRCLLIDGSSPIFSAAWGGVHHPPSELEWRARAALAAADGELLAIRPGRRPQG